MATWVEVGSLGENEHMYGLPLVVQMAMNLPSMQGDAGLGPGSEIAA